MGEEGSSDEAAKTKNQGKRLERQGREGGKGRDEGAVAGLVLAGTLGFVEVGGDHAEGDGAGSCGQGGAEEHHQAEGEEEGLRDGGAGCGCGGGVQAGW